MWCKKDIKRHKKKKKSGMSAIKVLLSNAFSYDLPLICFYEICYGYIAPSTRVGQRNVFRRFVWAV